MVTIVKKKKMETFGCRFVNICELRRTNLKTKNHCRYKQEDDLTRPVEMLFCRKCWRFEPIYLVPFLPSPHSLFTFL